MLTKSALRDLKHNTENSLTKAVITDLLSQGSTEEIKVYCNDLMQHGCISGMVTGLIYYNDTEAFFKKFFNEIFELLNNSKEELGQYPDIELNANNLAWFGYEQTVYNILNELEEEF